MNTTISKRTFLLNSSLITAGLMLPGTPATAKSATQKGKLAGSNGRPFPYTYTGAGAGGPTVVYIGGLGGRGNEVSKVAKDFTAAGLNLMTFDRAEPSCRNTEACRKKVAARVASGNIMASADGAKTAAQDIMQNELSAVFNHVISAPDYNPKKGIVLIGGSYGSWLSLVATQSKYKKHIKGVVFLSPAIAPEWISGAHAPSENVREFKRLVKAFGRRPAIAVGSRKDVFFRKTSTLDAANMLHGSLRSKPSVVDAGSSKHAAKLLTSSKSLRKSLIDWIAKSF